jgi:hypothetical protein
MGDRENIVDLVRVISRITGISFDKLLEFIREEIG